MPQPEQPRRPGLVDSLKEAIRDSGRSLNQIGKAAGIGHDRLSRFMRGERDLTLTSAEKVCEALGLRLTKEETPLQKPPRKKGD
jgi:DNA-binding phage protein